MLNILDPSVVASALPKYIGIHKTLGSPQDALAALVHTVLSILTFRLIGIDESSSQNTYEGNILPDGWNTHGPGNYTFRYRHDQSSLEFLVKLSKLGSKTVINAIAIETDKIATLDITTNDFTSASFFPYTVGASDAQPLIHGFISSNRVSDFVSQFNLRVVQKLIPGLRKEGYSEVSEDGPASSTPLVFPGLPGQRNPPAGPHPEAPDGPRFSPGRGSHIPPQNPLQIGRSDLDPIPFQNQPNPFSPPPLFPRNPGDGMFVGPEHPIFGGAFGSRRDPAGRGPWGGDGYLPPMGAPPGARFDPVVSGPFGPGGNPFGGGTGGRAPRRQGDPDNDEFMPPGAGDMFS